MTEEDNLSNKVITFGCRLNTFESEVIKKALEKSGEKNLIVFNSCAVTASAERELRNAIRKSKKQNPNSKIILTGCAAQIDPKKYAKMSEISLILGNSEKTNYLSYQKNFISESKDSKNINSNNEILHKDLLFNKTKKIENNFLTTDEISKIKVNDIMSVRETAPQLVSYFENQTRAFLEIQNGCNHRCTFCIIPYGRGNSRSVGFGEIVSQVRKMLTFGHKEIVFTGVDISDYGKDLAIPISLSQMIKRLLKLVPELPRLRLSSIDVAEIDEDFFEIIANEPRFMPYLHLSIQSGDDMILKRMKRRHTRDQLLEFCNKLKKIRPEVTFGADIIAGFPTEDDQAFQNSLSIISEANIIFTHIFPYSKRDGTPAAKMPQIDNKKIKERCKMLREAGKKQLNIFLEKQVNKEIKILLEKNNFGKSENFLDVEICYDSLKDNKIKAGEIITAKITGVKNNKLLGNFV